MRRGKMKISDLSDTLFQSNSTISGIIDRLEKQEIVERERSEEDKRVVYVKLTPKAEEIHRDFHKVTEENWGKIMSRGTPEDIEKVVEGLNTLKRLLNPPKN
jgi:MarR family transcriptional regulator, organic hydroperoxide resistance regulator